MSDFGNLNTIEELRKRVAELEGLLSNDTAEWKSAAFQKIKNLEANLEAKEAENTRLRKTIELAIGFCVNFRQTNTCWENHNDVALLFAKFKTALSPNGGKN